MKKFIDDLDPRTTTAVHDLSLGQSIAGIDFQSEKRVGDHPAPEDIDQKLAFAIAQNLKILLHEYIEASHGSIRDDIPFSLLHCMSRLVSRVYPHPSTLFPIRFPPASVELVPFLLQHGVRLNAVWNGETPFQYLFATVPYTKFNGSGNRFIERLIMNTFVGHLLEGGQDPNVDIVVTGLKRRSFNKITIIVCKALHVAKRDMAKRLLEHGAAINPLDSEGRTPLDLACGAGGNPYKLRDPDDALRTSLQN